MPMVNVLEYAMSHNLDHGHRLQRTAANTAPDLVRAIKLVSQSRKLLHEDSGSVFIVEGRNLDVSPNMARLQQMPDL